MRRFLLSAGFLTVFFAAIGGAQVVQAPYDASYTLTNLGSVPGLPTPYGGLDFLPSNSNVIVIGGAANTAPGALYSIGVTRGAGNHITGFAGSAALFSEGQNNDGGVKFGPAGVLFYTRYPINQIGQIEPGSTVNDRIIDLSPLGFSSSVGALNFVPAGSPGTGQLKVVVYNTGNWYTANYAPDGMGTFDITAPVLNTTIPGGPEGFVYVPPGSPVFPANSLLVSEYGAGVVSTYQVDGSGNPSLPTRAVFVAGLTGAEGAVIDPVTGDFLFSTFGGGNQVIVVQGFAIPVGETPTPTPTGPAATPTPTPTGPAATATPTATTTPTFAAVSAVVPTLSFPMLGLLGLLLAGAAFWMILRRS
ncbi:MAG TPA: hypothetical protein VFW15_03300 [Thermoanaerobaculia bacterium]|nr:hypothetical protein [Thermoanaerobaculia bacterium]